MDVDIESIYRQACCSGVWLAVLMLSSASEFFVCGEWLKSIGDYLSFEVVSEDFMC